MPRGKGKPKGSRKPHLTRFRHTSTDVNFNIFKRSESKNHAIRDGEFTYEFFHSVLQNARQFDLIYRDFIWAYQVILYAVTINGMHEFAFTVQKLRSIRYRQNDAEVFANYEREADEMTHKESNALTGKSGQDGYVRFMRIILLSEKTAKQELDMKRKVRSEKQAIGKAEAKRERELLAKEKELSRIRKEREKNKKLREIGMLAPAKKKSHKKHKTWI